ncbi:hypothetical protein [Paradevosia shaoguanensis]|uniref:Uncharacterized protein n=1 Tax=Paradevosia shaoguanensis TaxID=1335043 RepID=A0AA41QRM3_9HYPH|nr:hypothetical protein [Paradevosia shaoguanensis]MCF1744610.1 hypothetical protein [Paradevosia shaoguanensis]MCI0129093.1 hypothetical protein [Paradevosia shaoguanensis]
MTRILSGTAAVLAASRTVAFTGDPLSDANCPADGTVILGGAAYFIASRTDTSHFELTRDYEGVDGTVSCEIDPLNANAINLVKVARSITEYNAKLALTDAYGKGLFYECIGLTGANDPGPGKLARNAAAWADSTEIYMDVLDYGGHEQGALIDLAKAGTVYIVRGIDTGAYAAYTLSAAPENMGPDEWRKVSLSYVDGDGLIADGELVAVEWNRKGESFAADAEVDDMAGRAAYDNEAPGFVVKVNDDGTGRAVFFTMGAGGAGAWGSPAYLTGTKGDEGDQGDKGWAPQLVGVSDGERRVLKLLGYVGGAGAPPTANVGDYLKADGTFTANIAEAENYRGAPGAGNGTVVGPPSSVAGRVAVFSDTTGELIGDGGIALANLLRGALGGTDNRLLRSDGTGGVTGQGSAATLDDSGNLSGMGNVSLSGILSIAGLAGKVIRKVQFTPITTVYETTSTSAVISVGTSFSAVSTTSNLLVICAIDAETLRAATGDHGMAVSLYRYDGSAYVTTSHTMAQQFLMQGFAPAAGTSTHRGAVAATALLDNADRRSDTNSWSVAPYFFSYYAGCTAKLTKHSYIFVEFEP